MAVALGFMFMLGAGMIAAFLAGARTARSLVPPLPPASMVPAAPPRRDADEPLQGDEGQHAATPSVDADAAFALARQADLAEAKTALLAATLPASDHAPDASSNVEAGQSPPQAASHHACGGAEQAAKSMAGAAAEDDEDDSRFANLRRFPRSSFRGTATATIYPLESRPGREPVQCTVLTRDLSCTGIGIAHSEQLLPKQIIVLEAVGKLLVGEVRWCRRIEKNFYVAGCRLVKTTS
jgi:hypothetical protein